jgi:hypothetical protein
MASRRNDSVFQRPKISSDMFCLNFLLSVGEKRLVTLNVDASDNHLVSMHVFYPLAAQKLFGENWEFPINSYEITVRPLTDSVSRSIDGPDMTSWKPIANLCLDSFIYTCLTLMKNSLKWLAEEMIQFLKALNLIRLDLLELITICRWKKACNIVCWGLRQRHREYSYCLPNCGLETVWWKLTVSHKLVRYQCQTSDWHCITFNRRPRHDKLQTYCKSVPGFFVLDLFDFIEKLFGMASRRNDSVFKGPKSHQTCSAWTFCHLSVKRDLWHWMLRSQKTT